MENQELLDITRQLNKKHNIGYSLKTQVNARFIYLNGILSSSFQDSHPFDEIFEFPDFYEARPPKPGQVSISSSMEMSFDEFEQSEKSYNIVLEKYKINKGPSPISPSQITNMNAEKEIITGLLDRYQGWLKDSYIEIKAILATWLFFAGSETAPTLIKAPFPTREYRWKRANLFNEWLTSNPEKENPMDRRSNQRHWVHKQLKSTYEELYVLYCETGYLFYDMASGIKPELLKVDFQSLTNTFPATAYFTKEYANLTFGSALQFYGSEVRQYLKDATRLDTIRGVLDYLVYKSLVDQYVLNWEETANDFIKGNLPYADERPLTGLVHGNAKWLEYGPFIVNRDFELRSNGIKGKEKRANIIGELLNENYPIDGANFDGRALTRVLEKHKEGVFKRAQNDFSP